MELPPFDEVDEQVSRQFSPSRGVRPLLTNLYEALSDDPVDLARLKESLLRLTTFLASPEGFMDRNCRFVDSFLLRLGSDYDWYELLPEAYASILEDIAFQLHDAVSSPEIARNFDSLPAQLLERVRRL